MSRIILNLVSVFLIFDGNPVNSFDPTFQSYGCTTYLISTLGAADAMPVPCSTWYDARADRPSEYYTESMIPGPGQAVMGCIYAYDAAGNRSECVAQEPPPQPRAEACEQGTGVVGSCENYVVSSPAAEAQNAGTAGARRAEPERVGRGPAGRQR